MNTTESLVNITPKKKFLDVMNALKLPVLAIAVGLLIGGGIIAMSGVNPLAAIFGLIKGGYGSTYLLFTTLTRATPIIMAGLSAALVWGSGYESMGMGGQMTMGALVAAVVGARCPGPDIVVIVVTLLSGAAAGVLFSLIPSWMYRKFQASLLIATLMMNYVADYLSSYFVTYIIKDPYGADSSAVQTEELHSVLPVLVENYSLHVGFFIALFCVALMYFVANRTKFGYQARIGGLNSKFADYGGINSGKMTYMVLSLAAALAGLGGAIEVLGTRHRFVDQMITSPSYAWSGITASIMSNYNPIGVLLGSVFLAGLTTGGSYIERNMGVPSEISTVIQGVITMLATIKIVITFSKKHNKAGGGEKKDAV